MNNPSKKSSNIMLTRTTNIFIIYKHTHRINNTLLNEQQLTKQLVYYSSHFSLIVSEMILFPSLNGATYLNKLEQ